MPPVLPAVAEVRLVDHHCHGLITAGIERPEFESLLTEAAEASPLGTTLFDSLIGLAVRRWCAPVLDLAAHADPTDYLERRAELGATEVNRRFLTASGIGGYLIDAGLSRLGEHDLTTPTALAELCGAPVREVVRLERVAEDVVRAGTTAAGFAETVVGRLAELAGHAVGWKSIAAYRAGLALPASPPARTAVEAAADRWLSAVDGGAPIRLADPVLHGFLCWHGISLGLPLQFHVGYGDADLQLRKADPVLLTDFLRATARRGVPILLLHNYPYHREAAYLAQVFRHVFVDVGLATHNVGYRASAVLAELLELAPFGKVLFATDACGLGELYYLGSVLFRRALSDFLRGGLADGDWSTTDAARVAALIGHGNADRVYG